MSVELDTTTYKLTKSISKNSNYKTKTSEFGDGYRQITIDGINYERETWNLDFVPLDTTSAIVLEELLLNSVNGTSNYLSWTPHGESTTKYWTATEVNKFPVYTNLWKITCTLRREFPLST